MSIWVLLPLLALFATLGGYGLNRAVLMIIGAGLWFVAGAYEFTNYANQWDITYILGFVFIGIGLGTLIDSIYILIKQQGQENVEERRIERQEKIDEAIERRHDASQHYTPMEQLRIKQGLNPKVFSRNKARRNGG